MFEVHFQRWKSSHHRCKVNCNYISGFNNSKSFVKANLLPFKLRHFLAKSQKTLDFFRQLLGCLRSIFNAKSLYAIATKAITIKSVVLTTLTALWKLLYYRLRYAIFWQNHKNTGFALDNCLDIWGPFSTLKVSTTSHQIQLHIN